MKNFKNNPKRMKILSFLCLGLGLFMVFGGGAMANFDIRNLDTNTQDEFIVKKESFELKEIKKIVLDSYHTNIKIEAIQGDTIQIEYAENDKNPFNFKNENGKLSFKRGEEKFNLASLFQFNWFNFSYDLESDIILQIPESYIGDLSVDNSRGTISINGLQQLGNLVVSNDHDGIDLNNLKLQELDLSNSYGVVALENIQSAKNMDIEVDRDTLTMSNLQAMDMKINLNYCEARIEKIITEGDLSIESGHGEVSLDEISTKNLSIFTSYTPVEAGIIQSSNKVEIDADHDDVFFASLKALQLEVSSNYVDLDFGVCEVDDFKVDADHGFVKSKIVGSMNDFNIISDAQHGENTLPVKLNPTKEKKIEIVTNYGDIDVDFQEK